MSTTFTKRKLGPRSLQTAQRDAVNIRLWALEVENALKGRDIADLADQPVDLDHIESLLGAMAIVTDRLQTQITKAK
jgi:hypothetical protein